MERSTFVPETISDSWTTQTHLYQLSWARRRTWALAQALEDNETDSPDSLQCSKLGRLCACAPRASFYPKYNWVRHGKNTTHELG